MQNLLSAPDYTDKVSLSEIRPLSHRYKERGGGMVLGAPSDPLKYYNKSLFLEIYKVDDIYFPHRKMNVYIYLFNPL